MKERRYVTNLGNIGVYLLFIALFRPYFLPSPVYQMIKALAAGCVLLYVLTKRNKISLINLSVAVSFSIIVSSAISFSSVSDMSWRQLADAVIYGVLFYDVHTLCKLYEAMDKTSALTKCLLKINILYCTGILLFLNYSLGTELGDYNLSVYVFGNKFSTCYLFLQAVALYYVCFADKIRKNLAQKVIFIFLIMLSVFTSLYYGCATTLIANIVPVLIYFNPKGIRNLLYKPLCVLATISVATILPFLFNVLLLNSSVNSFVVNVLHRSINLSGRMNIYGRYILPVISQKPLFGYGYSNDAMKVASIYYTNAQNGLLQHILKYGIIGGIVLIIFILYCFRQSKQSYISDGALMMVYSMFIAGIVEVSYNWTLFLGLSLLAVVGDRTIKTTNIGTRTKRIKVKV